MSIAKCRALVQLFKLLGQPLPILLWCEGHVACRTAYQQKENSFSYSPICDSHRTPCWSSGAPLAEWGNVCPWQYQNSY